MIMGDVYFKASLQNTLNPEVGTFSNVKNKEGTFTLEDGEYYLTNNTSTSYGVYYPTKNLYSVGFTIEFDANYNDNDKFGWLLGFNGDDSTCWYGFSVYRGNLEFRGSRSPAQGIESDELHFQIVESPSTWLHVKCTLDYDYDRYNVHIYIDNVEVKNFYISNNYYIKYIDILGNSVGYVPDAKTKIKNIIIYDNKKHYLDTIGLTLLWSKIKSLFATKSDLSNYYTKNQIDILLSKVIVNQKVLGGAIYNPDIDEYNNETEQTMKTVSAVVEPTSVNAYTIVENSDTVEEL